MKVAIVHDWLVENGGAEKVLDELLTLYPGADLYTLINFSNKYQAHTSFLQKIPFVKRLYRYMLPLMPFAIEQFDLSGYDLIISSSSSVSKGVITHAEQLHICYCLSPMRYAWDLTFFYVDREKHSPVLQGLMRYFFHKLRLWDTLASNRVDHFLSISDFIARRIEKTYRREALTLYPPVDTEFFTMEETTEEHYITVGRLVSYKRVDLLVEAFNAMPEKKLIVIGTGPEYNAIKRKARKNITFLGHISQEQTRGYVQRAKAFVFAGIEDFGIAPLEAQSCGIPVIALQKGGLKETIVGLKSKQPTGVFFQEQTANAIIEACHTFEREQNKITKKNCRKNAERFSKQKFKKNFALFVETKYAMHKKENKDESTHFSGGSRNEALAHVENLIPQAISKVRRKRVAAKKDGGKAEKPLKVR
jgi:glycosyltransferase involved in cell wall biosynthesis